MYKLMVANVVESSPRYNQKEVEQLLKCQIHNLIDVGEDKKKIIILSNIDFSFMGVSTVKIDLNKHCLSGSKMFALKWLIDNHQFTETIHAMDLDCWQNVRIKEPKFRDVGICTYSNSKLNGGSVFWKPSSIDIINKILDQMIENKENREEPTINKILKSKEYKKRVTVINSTYNVGCSGFCVRYEKSEKPIKICHMNVTNKIAWETHVLDRNRLGEEHIPVGRRLERLLRKYYPNMPIKLKKEKHRKEVRNVEE